MSRVGHKCRRAEVLAGETFRYTDNGEDSDKKIYTLARGEGYADFVRKVEAAGGKLQNEWLYGNPGCSIDQEFGRRPVVIIEAPWDKKTFGPGTDFPHRCTRCGEWAYQGAFEVTHHDEENSTCRANRPTTLRKQA